MAKRRREPDSDDAAAETAELNPLFVDTSLDTHLAMLVSSSDTVSDFKKKLALEHKQCFPEIGEIQVHSLKVKRRSNFYHLPDIMLVWSAFQGVERNWFLSVDASSIRTDLIRNSLELGTSSGVKIGITNTDDNCRRFASDANRNEILPLALPDGAVEKNYVSEMIVGPEVEKPAEKIMDFQTSIYSEEHCTGTETHAMKKRKMRHTKDASHNSSLEGGDVMFRPDGKDGKPAMSDSIVKVSGTRNDQFDVEDKLVSKEASPPTTAETTNLGSIVDSQNLKDSNKRKEDNGFKSMMDYELGQDVQAGHSGDVSIMVPDTSARLMNAGDGGGDAKTAGSKRKKKKVHKTAAEIQDIINMEQIGKGERIKPTSETNKCDNKEEGKDLSLEHDREVIMPSNSIVTDHVLPDSSLKEASLLQDVEKSNFSVVSSQKLLDSEEKKEDNVLESKIDNGLDQDVPTVHSGSVIANVLDLSARVMDASGGVEGVNTNPKKRKKKKVQKITVEVQDTRDVEQIRKGEMKNPCTETNKSEEKEEENGLSLDHDNEVIPTQNSKAPDHVDPDLGPKETSFMRDADAVMETDISSGIKKKKKKKRGKNSVITSTEKSGITEVHNGIRDSSGLPCPSTDHTPNETRKEESTRHNDGNDDLMKLLDSSNHDAREKAQDINTKQADFVTKTQTEQTLEDVSIGNKKMAEKTQGSAGNCHTDFPTGETENTIMESNQVDKDNENAENKIRKTTKKRKKQKHTATDVQDNLPVKEQQVGIEPLATTETSIGFLNSEQEGIHVHSSHVMSRKSEETVGKMHEIVVNIDDLTDNSGKGNEAVNFKQYFLPGEPQYKRDSCDKVRKTTKSQKSSKRANVIDVPSVNISTEIQNSIKSFENKKTENTSDRKGSERRIKYDSAQNSDWDELNPSSEAPGKDGKDSSPFKLSETTLLESNDIVAASSFQNKKNPSLNKSSSERSETLPSNMGYQRSVSGLNGTNMMLMKAPKKKSLLAKSGAIFQDNSGESSGDENGTTHLDDGTFSPSESSSMSGDSGGESDISQNSTSNGSNDAKAKSSGRRNTSKIDVSASTDLTMDLILRSSKRFKKAKQQASQSESQPIEYVPDSQLF
ncbi:hypothetical protein C2S51_020037 [Perilla frutescens var. frutescens]|nr:hypothetical protein C2S51_020037 [Perilla frutescens var. frutescens]